MLEVRYIEEFELFHLRAREPFAFSENIDSAQEILARGTPEGGHLGHPLLADYREVELITKDTMDIQRTLARRRRLDPDNLNGFAAYVVGSEADYGMMRMFCANAAVHGVREIERSMVTFDIVEAATWLLAQSARTDVECLLRLLDVDDPGRTRQAR